MTIPHADKIQMNPETQQKEILNLVEEFNEARSLRRKSPELLVVKWEEGINALRETLEEWKFQSEKYSSYEDQIALEAIQQNQPIVTEVLIIAQHCLSRYKKISCTILHPKLVPIQEKIVADIQKFISHLIQLLELAVPDKSPMKAPKIFFETLIPSQIQGNKRKIRNYQIQLKALGNKKPDSKKTKKHKLNPLGSLRRIFFPVLFVIVLGFMTPQIPENIVESLRIFAKFFICSVFLLWFPTIFTINSASRSPGWILYLLIWAFILPFWVYGFLKGFMIGIIFLIPIWRLMQSNRSEIDREPQEVLTNSIYRWGWLSMFLVGSIVTRENLWLIGALIWWSFITIAKISFKNFRFTFDMISSLEPDKDSGGLKRKMIYISLTATIILLLSGILGPLSREFIQYAYEQAATISFGLIAILIGVQAIVPSIANWGALSDRDSTQTNEIREMKLYLRHNEGLLGFMQIFFMVFVLSLLGIGVTNLAADSTPFVDFSTSFLTTPKPNLLDILLPNSNIQYSASGTKVFLFTSLFTIFIALFFYSLVSIYYLFITTNSLTLPIKDALKSTPVIILNFYDGGVNENLVNRLKDSLQKSRKLRGVVISELRLIQNDGKLSCSVSLNEYFPHTQELISNIMNTLSVIFRTSRIESIQIFAFLPSIGNLSRQKVFSWNLTRQEFEFVNRRTKGLDTEYKMLQLGANIQRHHLPESQIF